VCSCQLCRDSTHCSSSKGVHCVLIIHLDLLHGGPHLDLLIISCGGIVVSTTAMLGSLPLFTPAFSPAVSLNMAMLSTVTALFGLIFILALIGVLTILFLGISSEGFILRVQPLIFDHLLLRLIEDVLLEDVGSELDCTKAVTSTDGYAGLLVGQWQGCE
jgi:hypothetical protein